MASGLKSPPQLGLLGRNLNKTLTLFSSRRTSAGPIRCSSGDDPPLLRRGQRDEVDPIGASFSGGAVGVILALMLIDANNVKQQEKKRCKYCNGTVGYLACARCSASGVFVSTEAVSIIGGRNSPLSPPSTKRCQIAQELERSCAPHAGMVMASEHDPRIDPFD